MKLVCICYIRVRPVHFAKKPVDKIVGFSYQIFRPPCTVNLLCCICKVNKSRCTICFFNYLQPISFWN